MTKSPKPDALHIIDPRSPSEYAQTHIAGAENLLLQNVSDTQHSLDPRLAAFKLLVVYGNDPGSAVARAMTKRLLRAGAKDVKLFLGGMVEWSKAGYPVEKGGGANVDDVPDTGSSSAPAPKSIAKPSRGH